MAKQMMRAVVLTRTGNPDVLEVSEVPVPKVKPGWVLVKIHAFGINRSELMLRASEADADYITLPRIPGIECVGVVADTSDSDFCQGQRVVALMGGMGRSFDGSYAEYALLPASNVFRIESAFSWEELAAIPETWFTAWGSLVECLGIREGQKLFVRAGTSALGLASIQLAKSFGCEVWASSRSEGKRSLLELAGADHVVMEGGSLGRVVENVEHQGFDAVLDLVGPSTLTDSFKIACPHGKVCVSGILGDKHIISNFDPIKDIPNGVSLMGFFSNYPDQKTIDALFDHIDTCSLSPIIAGAFPLDEVSQAHALMESNETLDKVVVSLGWDA